MLKRTAVISNTCRSMPVVIDRIPVWILRWNKELGSWPNRVNAVAEVHLHE